MPFNTIDVCGILMRHDDVTARDGADSAVAARSSDVVLATLLVRLGRVRSYPGALLPNIRVSPEGKRP